MNPDKNGYFGAYGGSFVPEILMPAVVQLEEAFRIIKKDKIFAGKFNEALKNYAGRPTPLTLAKNLSREYGCKIYLKREDLAHTGAHKINNAIGQALLAKKMGKDRVIAETGAGQHGVAVAAACSYFGLKAHIYMGTKDMQRQRLNVLRMRLMGANVIPVSSGSRTLKDAINEALRDWSASFESTHYLLGSVLGPHPYPEMVAYFQSVIGREAKKQILAAEGRLPDRIVACVGGGSNSIGIFNSFLKDKKVSLIGVEAAGAGIATGLHAARFADERTGRPGIIHGTLTYALQDKFGQIMNTHSISAGLDYPAVGPQHSFLKSIGRARYGYATDRQALEACRQLSQKEGIIPALESAHALAYALQAAKDSRDEIIIVNLSGRGDKDISELEKMLEESNGQV